MNSAVRRVSIVAGILAAALVPLSALGVIWLPFQFAHAAVLEILPTPVLARVLIGAAGSDVVADSRQRFPFRDGVTFYSRPRPAGRGICRVHIYSVPGDVTSGGRAGSSPSALETQTLFGVGGDPSASDGLDCQNYRDFDHLIQSESDEIVDAGLSLIDDAHDEAASNQTSFDIRCVSQRAPPGDRACDGIAYLRALDLKKIGSIRLIDDDLNARSAPLRFQIWITDDASYPQRTTRLTITGAWKGAENRLRPTAVEIRQIEAGLVIPRG